MEIRKLLINRTFHVLKKKVYGNRFTKANEKNVVAVKQAVVSSIGRKLLEKINQRKVSKIKINNDRDDYLCLVNFSSLKNLVLLLKCPECYSFVILKLGVSVMIKIYIKNTKLNSTNATSCYFCTEIWAYVKKMLAASLLTKKLVSAKQLSN